MLACRPGRRLTSLYLLTQGVLGAVWWVALVLVPAARARFQPEGYTPDFILTFAVPDVLLFVIGSSVAAALVRRGGVTGLAALWCVTGATSYAALHCLGIALDTGGFAHAAAMMGAAAVCVVLFALTLGSEPGVLPTFPFRESRRPQGIVVRLVLQIVVFWLVLLLLIPLGLDWVEASLGLPSLGRGEGWDRGRTISGWVLFLVASVLNLWVATVMLRRGRGTPLPSECASRLVTSGPYAFVRNPMAVAALGQGLAVAMILGSWLTAGYMAIGTIYWHLAVRPAEELDLQARFGAAYEMYRARVRCWVPRFGGSARAADRVG